MTPAAVRKAIAAGVAAGALPGDALNWPISVEVENPDLLEDAPGVYFIAEMVAQPRGSAIRIARYVGQSEQVRTEVNKQRSCKWMGGCEGRARIFAVHTGDADLYFRRLVEWAFHQDYKPTISTATKPRRRR